MSDPVTGIQDCQDSMTATKWIEHRKSGQRTRGRSDYMIAYVPKLFVCCLFVVCLCCSLQCLRRRDYCDPTVLDSCCLRPYRPRHPMFTITVWVLWMSQISSARPTRARKSGKDFTGYWIPVLPIRNWSGARPQSSGDHKLHSKFHDELCDQLLAYQKYSPRVRQLLHTKTKLSNRGYCVWGLRKIGITWQLAGSQGSLGRKLSTKPVRKLDHAGSNRL